MRTDASLDALLADALTSDYANTPPSKDNAGGFRIFFVAGAIPICATSPEGSHFESRL